jgi:hypothetical protein
MSVIDAAKYLGQKNAAARKKTRSQAIRMEFTRGDKRLSAEEPRAAMRRIAAAPRLCEGPNAAALF